MIETPGLVISMHKGKIDDASTESSYVSTTRFLRKNYSYMFDGPKGSTESLLLST